MIKKKTYRQLSSPAESSIASEFLKLPPNPKTLKTISRNSIEI